MVANDQAIDAPFRQMFSRRRLGRFPTGWRLPAVFVVGIWLTLGLHLGCDSLLAADRAAFTLTATSIERLQSQISELLDLADRPELSDVLAQRLAAVKDLPGIDRSRPLCLMRFPPADRPEGDLLVIPTKAPKLAVQTLTAGIVDYQQTAEDLFTIDRPGSPYYALAAGDYLWLGDSLTRLRSQAQSGPPRAWRPGDPDLRLVWSWEAVPVADRQASMLAWRQGIEPWLQRRDDESEAAYRLRRLWGEAVRLSGETLWQSVEEVAVSIRVDGEDRRGVVDVDVRLAPHHPAAAWLSRWQGSPHPLREWAATTDVRASGFLQLPAGSLATTGDSRPLVLAWQVFGDDLPVRTAVLTLDRAPASPPKPTLADRPIETEMTVVRIPKVPDWVRSWIGGNTEALQIAAGEQTWWGFGPPLLAQARLQGARESLSHRVETTSAVDQAPVADIRIPLKEVWDWFPFIDPIWAQQQLQDRDDRVRLTFIPHRDRLQFQAVIPEGGLCVVAGWFVDELSLDLQQFLSDP